MNVAERICALLDENESLKKELKAESSEHHYWRAATDEANKALLNQDQRIFQLVEQKRMLEAELNQADEALDAAVCRRDDAEEALHYKEKQVREMDLEISRLRETPIWAENEDIVYSISNLYPLRQDLEKALKDEYKIQALKILREATKCSLATAKKVIERIIQERDDEITF